MSDIAHTLKGLNASFTFWNKGLAIRNVRKECKTLKLK